MTGLELISMNKQFSIQKSRRTEIWSSADEKMLLNKKKTENPIKEPKRYSHETKEIKMVELRETFSIDTPLILERIKLMVCLTNLEKHNFSFTIRESFIKHIIQKKGVLGESWSY